MTTVEKTTCLNQLQQSKNDLLAVLKDVSESLFLNKPNPDVWSIAEVLEHVIKVETTVIITLQQLAKSVAKTPLEQPKSSAEVMELSASRALKSKAPPNFLPDGIFTSKEVAIETFEMCRNKTNDFVNEDSIDLKAVTFPHPRIGILNGNNWLTFISGHCQKHIAQIKDLKVLK